MKLEPPLSRLVERCETLCVSQCCGIDAYDFSPIHIASYLILTRGSPDRSEVAQIQAQLATLRVNYGSSGVSARGATFEDLNQIFSGEDIDSFVQLLLTNIDRALIMITKIKSEGPNRI
jgi:hypothetical protein